MYQPAKKLGQFEVEAMNDRLKTSRLRFRLPEDGLIGPKHVVVMVVSYL
jgi:hypothetical protein